MNYIEEEQENIEDFIEKEETQEETVEEVVEENIEPEKTKLEIEQEKVSDLYRKLEELQEKLANEELSPIKRFLLQNKFSIIETRIEKQLARLDIEKIKLVYEEHKDEMYEKYNEQLKIKQEELDNIFDEIEEEERIVEQKATAIKNRELDYKTINNAGKLKNTRSTYQFNSNNNIQDEIKEQQNKLELLKAKKDTKIQEILDFKNQFVEYEKSVDRDMSTDIAEYKTSIWKDIRNLFKRISNNFKEWRKNSKEERVAVQNAKQQAKMNIRNAQQANLQEENKEKMNEFREILDSKISLTDQNRFAQEMQNNNQAPIIQNDKEDKSPEQ